MSTLKETSHQKWNFHGTVQDFPLRELARKFLKFSPFPESDPEGGEEVLINGTPLKHLSKFPGMEKWAVRHYIEGKMRYIAFAEARQIDDAMRFADATTYRFWKYRRRTADVMCESHFNYSIAHAQADLEDWQDSAPEVMSLIDEIESHFLEAGLFVDPATRETDKANPHSAAARRTVRGELRSLTVSLQQDAADRHQEILDCVAALAERLDAQDQKLNELRKCMRFAPGDPFGENIGPNPMFSTSTGDPLNHQTLCTAGDIFIPPLTGEVRITLQEPPYTK